MRVGQPFVVVHRRGMGESLGSGRVHGRHGPAAWPHWPVVGMEQVALVVELPIRQVLERDALRAFVAALKGRAMRGAGGQQQQLRMHQSSQAPLAEVRMAEPFGVMDPQRGAVRQSQGLGVHHPRPQG